MDDLVQWLGKQLDEDQRIAEGAGGRRGEWRLARPLDDAELGDASFLRPPELKHAERHDPARVLREIDAKRQLLALHKPEEIPEHSRRSWQTFTIQCAGESWKVYSDAENRVEWPCLTVRLLALPYADRPGYQESWRP